MGNTLIDETGNRHGRLTVIERAKNIDKNARWLCLCDCGTNTVVHGKCLRNGHTQSCGCLQRERAAESATSHGFCGTPTYTTWYGMKDRCTNPSRPDYHGRGIVVCERWMNFENFLKDVGARPSPAHSLDRRDNDGNYEPRNCRWVTRKEQNRNARSNVLLTHNGKTQCLAAWAEESGMRYGTLHKRIKVLKWSVGRALCTPVYG